MSRGITRHVGCLCVFVEWFSADVKRIVWRRWKEVEREDAAAVREEVICQDFFNLEFSWKRLRWKILHQTLMRRQSFSKIQSLSQHQKFYFCHLLFCQKQHWVNCWWQKHSVNLVLIGQSRQETWFWKFDSTLFTLNSSSHPESFWVVRWKVQIWFLDKGQRSWTSGEKQINLKK